MKGLWKEEKEDRCEKEERKVGDVLKYKTTCSRGVLKMYV